MRSIICCKSHTLLALPRRVPTKRNARWVPIVVAADTMTSHNRGTPARRNDAGKHISGSSPCRLDSKDRRTNARFHRLFGNFCFCEVLWRFLRACISSANNTNFGRLKPLEPRKQRHPSPEKLPSEWNWQLRVACGSCGIKAPCCRPPQAPQCAGDGPSPEMRRGSFGALRPLCPSCCAPKPLAADCRSHCTYAVL